MTTKTFSQQGRMGRNPFAPRATTEAAPQAMASARGETRAKQASRAETSPGSDTLYQLAFEFPVRSIFFGLKSLLVVRYLFAHPKELRLF